MWLREGDQAVCDQIAQHGTYEPDVLGAIQREVRAGMRTVDAGAHVGFFTLHMARLVGPLGRVYAFEPDPENFAILKANAKDAGNIMAEPAALTDGPGKAVLSLNQSENKGDNRLWHADPSNPEVLVPTTSLDAYFEGTSVEFVKADIQGCEYLMLKGAVKTVLRAARLTMVVEYDKGLMMDGFDVGPEAFMTLCDELELSVSLLDGTRIADAESLDSVAATWFNLLLRKRVAQRLETREAP